MKTVIRHHDAPEGVPLNRMIKAYPAAHACEIIAPGVHLGGMLIDMNYASARIRLRDADQAAELRLDQVATLNTHVGTTRQTLNGIRCRVAWASGWEIGVEFETSLGVGILELQAAFETDRAA